MWRMAYVLAATATLGVAGFLLGTTIYGATPIALVPTIAGAAGGFGIGAASLDVLRRWREASASDLHVPDSSDRGGPEVIIFALMM